jgi:hypothetical protein
MAKTIEQALAELRGGASIEDALALMRATRERPPVGYRLGRGRVEAVREIPAEWFPGYPGQAPISEPAMPAPPFQPLMPVGAVDRPRPQSRRQAGQTLPTPVETSEQRLRRLYPWYEQQVGIPSRAERGLAAEQFTPEQAALLRQLPPLGPRTIPVDIGLPAPVSVPEESVLGRVALSPFGRFLGSAREAAQRALLAEDVEFPQEPVVGEALAERAGRFVGGPLGFMLMPGVGPAWEMGQTLTMAKSPWSVGRLFGPGAVRRTAEVAQSQLGPGAAFAEAEEVARQAAQRKLELARLVTAPLMGAGGAAVLGGVIGAGTEALGAGGRLLGRAPARRGVGIEPIRPEAITAEPQRAAIPEHTPAPAPKPHPQAVRVGVLSVPRRLGEAFTDLSQGWMTDTFPGPGGTEWAEVRLDSGEVTHRRTTDLVKMPEPPQIPAPAPAVVREPARRGVARRPTPLVRPETAEEVVARAAAGAPEFEAFARGVAQDTGGELVLPPAGVVKTAESLRANATRKGISLLDPTDHRRATIVVANDEALLPLVERMGQEGWRVRDSLTSERGLNGTGYRGLHATRRAADGLNEELILTTRELWELKKRHEGDYIQYRNLDFNDLESDPGLRDAVIAHEEGTRAGFDGYVSKMPADLRSAISKASSRTESITSPIVTSPAGGLTQRPPSLTKAPVLETQQRRPVPSRRRPIISAPSEAAIAPSQEQYTTPGAEVKPGTAGSSVRVRTEPGSEVQARYRVVEADQVIASNRTDFSRDPRHPEDLQPVPPPLRKRDAAALQEHVDRMAHALEPDRLGEWPLADNGAPVVDELGNVVAGNGRAIAVQLGYRAYPNSAAAYKGWLIGNAERFGLDADAVRGMDRPMLVRQGRWADAESKIQFARESDIPATAMRPAAEVAQADARLIGDEVLSRFVPNDQGNVNTAANADFRRAFLQRVVTSPTERNAMLQADGTFSQQGIERVRAALFQKAYGNADLSARLTEATDETGLGVLKAALQATPLEAARFFRREGMGAEEVRAEGLEITQPNIERGLALARLGDVAWGAVDRGEVGAPYGAEIGRAFPDDPVMQDRAILRLRELGGRRKVSPNGFANLLADMRRVEEARPPRAGETRRVEGAAAAAPATEPAARWETEEGRREGLAAMERPQRSPFVKPAGGRILEFREGAKGDRYYYREGPGKDVLSVPADVWPEIEARYKAEGWTVARNRNLRLAVRQLPQGVQERIKARRGAGIRGVGEMEAEPGPAPEHREALMGRRSYIAEHLRAEGIVEGTQEARTRSAELEAVHRTAVEAALRGGQITPEQASDVGHFVTYPQLAERYGMGRGERPGPRVVEAPDAERRAARQERIAEHRAYFASKRGQRGRALMPGGDRNPYAGEDAGLGQDLYHAFALGRELVGEGTDNFKVWSAQMVEHCGDWVKEHLTRLWHEVVRDWQHSPREERAPGENIMPGATVFAADRQNYGKVVSVNEPAGEARVHFVSPEGTEATVDLPMGQLTDVGGRAARAYEMMLEVPSASDAPAEMIEKAKSQFVTRQQARQLKQPALSLTRWYQGFTKMIANTNISLENAMGAVNRIIKTARTDPEAVGLAKDAANTMKRAATAAGWQLHNAEKDGWYGPQEPLPDGTLRSRKVGMGMEEIYYLAVHGREPPRGLAAVEEGIRRALHPEQDVVDRFKLYSAMRRIRELQQKGMDFGPVFTPRFVEDIIRVTQTPEFERAHGELQNWFHQARLVVEEKQWRGKGWADGLRKDHPNYLPAVREIVEPYQAQGGGWMRPDQAVPELIQRIRGGALLIRDPFSQAIAQTRALLEITHLWESRRQLIEGVREARKINPGIADQIARELTPEELPTALTPEQATRVAQALIDELVNAEGEAKPITQEAVKAALYGHQIWSEAAGGRVPPNVLPVMERGKVTWWQFHPDVFEVYAEPRQVIPPKLSRSLPWEVMRAFKTLKQLGTTVYSTAFQASNFKRDLVDAIMQSEQGFGILREMVTAIREAATGGERYRAVGRAGGFQGGTPARAMEMSTLGAGLEPTIGGRAVAGAARAWTGIRPRLGAAADPMEGMCRVLRTATRLAYQGVRGAARVVREIGERGEQIPRLASALAEEKAGARQGLSVRERTARAALQARISTLPFEEGGWLTRIVNDIRAFTSAQVQGWYTPFRVFAEHPLRTAIRGTLAITIPQLISYAWNYNNPDYHNLPAYRKYGFLNIPVNRVPGARLLPYTWIFGSQQGETIWLHLPMVWTWGVLFGGAPIAALEAMLKKDPQAASEFVGQAWNGLSPLNTGLELKETGGVGGAIEQVLGAGARNLPDIFTPGAGLWANQDWNGRPIVPSWEQREAPEKQVSDYNSELARYIGLRVPGGMSPRKVDYLLDQYGGNVGKMVRGLTDKAIAEGSGKPVGITPQKPTGPGETILPRRFFSTASRSSDLREDFYAEFGRLEKVDSRYKDAEDIPEEVIGDLDRYDEAKAVRQQLTDISADRKEILRSDAGKEEKRKQLAELTNEETVLLSEFLGKPAPAWAQ